MKKTYSVDNSHLCIVIIVTIIVLCIVFFLFYPIALEFMRFMWQKEMHGFAILLKIIVLLFMMLLLAHFTLKPLFDVYYSVQRTLYERNATFTIDDDTLTMIYENEQLKQKQIVFTYKDIAEILQRAHLYIPGHYIVTLTSGESFTITSYMEGFVPIARKFANEHPDNYIVKGGNILLPRKKGSFF